MATVLSVIAPHGFQPIEYHDSKEALEAAGHRVVTGCSEPVAADKQGGTAKADVLLENIRFDDYDAVLFVGGPGCFDYFDDPAVHEIAQNFVEAGKPVAAICAAPSILANAGLLTGVTCTCHPSRANHLRENGANYTGNPVETDGLIVTADGPASSEAFGEALADLLF